jgi:molecular chaperone GrpE
MDKDKKDINEQIITNGIYKHYKNKNYKVLYEAIDSETKEELVVYQALYGEEKIWARPKKMFLEKVEVDGGEVPRFQLIEKDENDWENKYKRALADYQNLLKQTAREKAEFGQFAREQFLIEVLPVYDNLKASLIHFNEDHDQSNWIKGVEYVAKQFKDILSSMGIEEIKTLGEKFDHYTMEALKNEETEDEEKDGTVAQEVLAGYKLNGKIIRVARVAVYKVKSL